jgi:hypothetical protein
MPLKPEVVFEAGNRAQRPGGGGVASQVPSLSVLTTNADFVADQLTWFPATSAATEEAARFATSIMAAHPDDWPETVRALMVHSARSRSHGLRFDLRRRAESERTFLGCVNELSAASDEDAVLENAENDVHADEEIEPEADKGWIVGTNSRAHKSPGSLHCDVWQGTASDLAARRHIAAYPVSGW